MVVMDWSGGRGLATASLRIGDRPIVGHRSPSPEGAVAGHCGSGREFWRGSPGVLGLGVRREAMTAGGVLVERSTSRDGGDVRSVSDESRRLRRRAPFANVASCAPGYASKSSPPFTSPVRRARQRARKQRKREIPT